MMKERFNLLYERLLEVKEEAIVQAPFQAYFSEMADLLAKLCKLYTEIEEGTYFQQSEENLKRENHAFYEVLKPGSYEKSFACPDYALETLGQEYGAILSFLNAELRSIYPAVFEQNLFELLIRGELFLEIYTSFLVSFQEEKKAPLVSQIKEIIYFFFFDYMDEEMDAHVRNKVDPASDFAYKIITESDLTNTKYLYQFGEYISKNQIKTAAYLAKASDEQIKLMADTYTEGYRIGFVKGNKDLSKKKVVEIRYPIGFERMIKQAIENFEKMGLKPTIVRSPHSIFTKRGMLTLGYFSESPNKQYQYDHKEDEALFSDKKLFNRKLELQRKAYEHYKTLAGFMAGPAVVEVFGEVPFSPKSSQAALKLSEKQQKLSTWYYGELAQMINEYIKGEERSFTIIAFPVPEIGDKYEEIMDETIKLNTLDYQTYEDIQQAIIDALDKASYVQIKGQNGNHTDLKVMLTKLENPEKQTIFENCVADVNIPVGEVFTSPVLKGTEGTLHVSRVFLNELEYRDLEITFEDGYIKDYRCGNFEKEEEGKQMIFDNVLYHHTTLPIGEFAIGTNTTAYVMGRKYKIEDRLPILIAEKTGPHFAVGDTCYSHAEDVAVYNPDGKEIIVRDNETSLLRKTDPSKAYFQCHTDITIPYDELGALYGVTPLGEEIWIIRDGRFVLEAAKPLNKPLECE